MRPCIPLFLFFLVADASGMLVTAGDANSQTDEINQNARNAPRSNRHSLPETLDPAGFADKPGAYVSYLLAGRIRETLAKVPCFCPCHYWHGHRSLLDCFAGRHGESCGICQQEVILCYELRNRGKSARQIRKALRSGNWMNVDVNTYASHFIASVRDNRKD
jgi:hypothetical protein